MTQDDYLDLPMERAAAREDEFHEAVARYIEENRAELIAECKQQYEAEALDLVSGEPTDEELYDLAAERVDRLMSDPPDEDD